jgi:Mlc titration factor MtfA (ptsG expression regulator)
MTEHMVSMATTLETCVNLNPLSLQEKLDITDKMNATSYVPYKKSLKNMPFLCGTVTSNHDKILRQSVSEQLSQKELKTEKYRNVPQCTCGMVLVIASPFILALNYVLFYSFLTVIVFPPPPHTHAQTRVHAHTHIKE